MAALVFLHSIFSFPSDFIKKNFFLMMALTFLHSIFFFFGKAICHRVWVAAPWGHHKSNTGGLLTELS